MLLEAGADPNDGQALYNRMFEPGNDHLELLFEFGLGTGDGGLWRAKFGPAVESTAELMRGQLNWAVVHGMADRTRLLIDHGADFRSPFADGKTPAELAATCGHRDLAELLVSFGARAPELGPADELIAAALDADRAVVDRLKADHSGIVEQVRRERPGLVVWAAVTGRADAVTLLVELGFDLNARSRTDGPCEMPWETALHRAAQDGNVALTRLLLDLGADPDIRDGRFDGTPLSWARHFGQREVIDLLIPVTGDAG